MESTEKQTIIIQSRLEAGERLAVRLCEDRGAAIILVENYDDAPVPMRGNGILEDASYSRLYWAQSATHALISAWLDGIRYSDSRPRISWNRKADPVYTDVMDVLAIAGLIVCRSAEQEIETVTRLNYDPILIAKFTEIGLALVESETTRAAADDILTIGLRKHLNGIWKMDPIAMAGEFAAAWHQNRSRATTEAE